MSNDHLEISRVSIEFPTDNGPFKVLDDIDLKIAKGEFVSLIGHSGCGKSTVLNIVAGLHQATTGGVILDGKEVNEPGPDRAVVFQNHSLLPWLTAYENVELAVRQVFKGRKSRREMAEWIEHNLELVQMGHALHKRPDEISGGMKQRVGIARALSMEPKVLLLDEPFGALDALTRTHMQDSLMEIHQDLGNTVIMITHDVDEAVLLSDRIVMMTNGPAATVGDILQVRLPRPRDRLALADDPEYNHYRAEVVRFLHERHGRAARPAPAQPEPQAESSQVLDLSEYKKERSGADGRVEKTRLKIGFIPLTDCAPLVVAKEKGFFARHGLDVTLSLESSWANIRDKVGYGVLDGAQMLAAIPLASALPSRGESMIAAMSLDLNGNAITVSNDLYARLQATGRADLNTPIGSAEALYQVIDEGKAAGAEPLTFAMVFPESSHNYLLRYWMASAGIDPDVDVRLIVVPPPQMLSHLEQGLISGYCVGEPWNAQAVKQGTGHTLVASYDVWNNHPEKVFGVTRAWAERHPNTLQALLMALLESCAWLDQEEHRREVCELLSRPGYVGCPVEVLQMSMTGTFQFNPAEAPRSRPDFNVFHRYAANYPWRSHALWTLSQMMRWGQIEEALDLTRIAAQVYQPGLYRKAAAALGYPVIEQEHKSEGGHPQSWTLREGELDIPMGADVFMDGRKFNPGDVMGYLNGFAINRYRVDLGELIAANPASAAGRRETTVGDTGGQTSPVPRNERGALSWSE
jgi:nitrate/nitrite transport system ATP-binding protein